MFPSPIKRVAYQALGPQDYSLAMSLYRVGRGCERSYRSFLRLFPTGGRLLDIGANVGITVAYARRERPDVKILAFEPLPFNVVAAKRLWRLLRIKDVDFREVALGDSTGIAEMVMPIVGQMSASGQSYVIHDGFDYSPVLNEGGEQFTVPQTMIDSLELPRVDGIKLDVENFEAHVLRGGIDLLKRDHPLIYCELWDTPNRYEVMALLGTLGYSCEKMDTKEDFLFRYSCSPQC
jgi:FkbM family methyltransferase